MPIGSSFRPATPRAQGMLRAAKRFRAWFLLCRRAGAARFALGHRLGCSGAAHYIHTFAEGNLAIGRAEALSRAMLSVIEDRVRPDAAHPSFWAPFVVVGEGRPVDPPFSRGLQATRVRVLLRRMSPYAKGWSAMPRSCPSRMSDRTTFALEEANNAQV